MIHGIGSDIVSISRIKTILEVNKFNFLKKIFTNQEIAKIPSGVNMPGYIAKRFAAKEAFSKAYGTGIGSKIAFHDIEIEKDENSKPFFKISSKIEDFEKLYKPYLSMSDEREFAIAFVVIEKK